VSVNTGSLDGCKRRRCGVICRAGHRKDGNNGRGSGTLGRMAATSGSSRHRGDLLHREGGLWLGRRRADSGLRIGYATGV
jgi:hypothetical protein